VDTVEIAISTLNFTKEQLSKGRVCSRKEEIKCFLIRSRGGR